ncbi:MAG: hypothetical protein E6Q97_29745 [Desulfurellales bacterium]|nr:MAG: hypothetical protein E6Q97_29745 [Desulfurellales bacterium]
MPTLKDRLTLAWNIIRGRPTGFRVPIHGQTFLDGSHIAYCHIHPAGGTGPIAESTVDELAEELQRRSPVGTVILVGFDPKQPGRRMSVSWGPGESVVGALEIVKTIILKSEVDGACNV